MDAVDGTHGRGAERRGARGGGGGAPRRAAIKLKRRNDCTKTSVHEARRTNLVPGSTSSRVGGRAEGVLSVTGKVARSKLRTTTHREGISLHWEMKSRSEAATDRPIASDLRERHQDNVQKHCGGSQGETLPIDIHSTHSQYMYFTVSRARSRGKYVALAPSRVAAPPSRRLVCPDTPFPRCAS